ncbi:MAG: hypothetical protein FWH23_08545, partial [Bacteroidales bacterium]|nr:hypothetical protein [Bacteroidales bacterium]
KENTFDRWKSEYQGAPEVRQAYLASLSSGANSYDRYYPPYQLVATNGTAQVKAQLSLTEFGQNFVHEDSVFFVTPTGLRYHAVYEQPTKTYTITLSGAEDRTVTEVYAIAKRHPSDQSGDLKNYYTLGKLGLANYNTNHNLKLVLVNIDGQINAATAREKLNQIYAPLGFSWEVSEDNGFDAGNAVSADSLQFTGSSWLSQYTEGMKRLHAKYRDYKGENFDESANYVFVMKNAGVSNLAGDMPRRSQFGYIFTDALGDVYRTLAHELGHGKFTLMHPIDGAYGSLKDLPNLMNTTLINDTLAKWQWDILHDPAWLVIFDKDKEGMLIKNTATGTYIPLAEKGPAFLTPSGAAIKIAGITHGEFNEDGGLLNFYLDETDLYHGAFSGELFYGYIKASDAPKIVNQHPTEELLQELDKLSFKQYSFAEQGDMVFAQAKRKRANMYTNCVCEYTWPNPKKSTGIKGTPTLPIISPTAVETNCAGVMCAGSDDGLKEGPGAVLYYNLLQTVSTDVEIDSLKSFANRMTDILKGKTFILYAEDLTDDFVTKDFTYTSLQYLIRNKINSYTKFTTDYGFKQLSNGAHDCDIIFSSVDLWEDADYETYNAGSVDWESYTLRPISNEEELFEALDRLEYIVTEIKTDQPEAISPTSYDNLLQYIYECSDTPELALQDLFHLNQTFKSIYAYLGAYNNYEYRVADLRTRQLLKQTDNVFWAYISEMERKGAAVPVSTNNSYQQYVAYYGTQSTFFLAQEYIGMIGIAYSLYGISQTVNMTGNALRGIIQQRGALRIAVSRNNLLGSKIEYDARLANNQRLAQDVKYQQYRQEKHGGDATDTKNWQDRNIGKDPVQNQIKNELCEQLYNTRGVTEIRVNQTHSSAQGKALGLNRPDIAPRYNEARYYFEIDAANSNRGIGHYQRIIANDPIAATSNTPIEIQNIVQEIALKYNCTYQINGRVILIQLQ